MKKITKTVALLCAALLMVSAFTACGNKEETVATTDGKNFSYWAVMDATSSKMMSDYNEMMFYQELEKRTGVHIDFIHPIQGSTGNEAFVSMLASEEKPDLIEYNWANYSGGPQQALDDGVIISLNDYLEDHAPNYYDYMEGEKGKASGYIYRLESSTDEGLYYGFNVLNIGETKGFYGIYTRADLLKKWGMEIPETIDEWTAVFAKAKAEGFQKPFTSQLSNLSFTASDMHTFNTAYGVGKSLYLKGDKVVFAPFEKGFKDYVAQLAEWTKLGYIDTSFITNDTAKIEGNMANSISMTACGYVGGGIGKILPALQSVNAEYDLVACPFPVAKKGEVSEFQEYMTAAKTLAIGVSSECGNYEKAIEWCDYIYSPEGIELQIFGIEGDTFTVEEIDGEKHYKYTEKITDYASQGLNSVSETLYKYMLPCNHPGYNQHIDYLMGYYQMDQQRDAIEKWNLSAEKAAAHKLPNINYTTDEARENTDIKEVAQAELETAICDIILGKKSIDEYDKAIEEAKGNGYDRLIEIAQGAYDRYISKLDK